MYKFKDKEIVKKYNKRVMAEIIGLNSATLRRIINGTQECSKVVAYAITKFINQDSFIEYYFEKVR